VGNNLQTRNVGSLLLLLLYELERVPREPHVALDWLLNLLFVSRLIIKYFIEHLSFEDCRHHFQPAQGTIWQSSLCRRTTSYLLLL